ncbi:hypothetical protein [Streptomyces erythrochromogenes]|uniref:hypothetical protein n=1 Tax=Streptomyces erythrochromogenes TaxID=285574 RepID=UPI0036BD24F1
MLKRTLRATAVLAVAAAIAAPIAVPAPEAAPAALSVSATAVAAPDSRASGTNGRGLPVVFQGP